jgi:transposase
MGSTRNLKVFAYPSPTDLRCGFEGLYGLVEMHLKRDPLSGDCFLFTNRDRTRAKVLMWDGTGLCIYHKRLERGRFACLWREKESGYCALTMTELALFLEGSKLVGNIQISPDQYQLKGLADRLIV